MVCGLQTLPHGAQHGRQISMFDRLDASSKPWEGESVDWNWLFSSVAQSVAALVGVMGAFLISRVLGSESSFKANCARTQELRMQTQTLLDRATARDIEGYAFRELQDELDDVARSVRDGDEADLRSAEEYYDQFEFTPMFPRERVLEVIQETIDEALAARGDWSSAITAGLRRPEYAVAARQNMRGDREAVAQLRVDIKDHMRRVSQHVETLSSQPDRSSVTRATLVALLLMFFGGVLAPLSYLPVATGQTLAIVPTGLAGAKWLSLAIASVVFSGLMIGLGMVNERFTNSQDDIDELQEALEPEFFSACFGALVENGGEL